jgi:hypothetical protein
MTAHSPVGINPEAFGVIPITNEITFANNDIAFKDKTGIDHEKFSFGLKKSLFNYMHGICFDYDLQDWFDFKIPRTKMEPDFIQNALQKEVIFSTKSNAKIVWTGGVPLVETFTKSKKGNSWEMMNLTFHLKTHSFEIALEADKGNWLVEKLSNISVTNEKVMTFQQLKTDFELSFEDFELFWYSKSINNLKTNGLLVL